MIKSIYMQQFNIYPFQVRQKESGWPLEFRNPARGRLPGFTNLPHTSKHDRGKKIFICTRMSGVQYLGETPFGGSLPAAGNKFRPFVAVHPGL